MRRLLFALVLLAVPALLAAEQPKLIVHVRNQLGFTVKDLKAEDFAVTQDKVPRPVAQAPKGPWMDRNLSPERRAEMVIEQMTLDEKINMVHGGTNYTGPASTASAPAQALGIHTVLLNGRGTVQSSELQLGVDHTIAKIDELADILAKLADR